MNCSRDNLFLRYPYSRFSLIISLQLKYSKLFASIEFVFPPGWLFSNSSLSPHTSFGSLFYSSLSALTSFLPFALSSPYYSLVENVAVTASSVNLSADWKCPSRRHFIFSNGAFSTFENSFASFFLFFLFYSFFLVTIVRIPFYLF